MKLRLLSGSHVLDSFNIEPVDKIRATALILKEPYLDEALRRRGLTLERDIPLVGV